MPAYRAMPATGGNFPSILVVQEIFGVHEHIATSAAASRSSATSRSRRSSSRAQGDPRKITDIAEAHRRTSSPRRPTRRSWPTSTPPSHTPRRPARPTTRKLGVTGFCWGGRIVLMYAAHNPERQGGRRLVRPDRRATSRRATRPRSTSRRRSRRRCSGCTAAPTHGIPDDTVEKMFAALKAAATRSPSS